MIDLPEAPNSLLAELLLDTMRQKGQLTALVTSDSMAPLIRSGDQIVIVHANSDDLAPGEIVVISVANDLIVHRYWKTSQIAGELFLLTRGDRLADFDPLLAKSSLVGLVHKRIRNRSVVNFRKTPGRQINKVIFRFLGLEAKLTGMDTSAESRHSSLVSYRQKKSKRVESIQQRAIRRLFNLAAGILAYSLEFSTRKLEVDQQ